MSAYTAAQIEAVLGVPPSTLRSWVRRGQVRKAGRELYDGDSVIARWQQQADEEAARNARCPAPL
jgi:transposase-like protein